MPLANSHKRYDFFFSGQISPEAFDSYCYISSTFTLPPPSVAGGDASSSSHSGRQIYPGVGPRGSRWLARDRGGDADASYHNYYQWVAYLLFLQSLSFFLPLNLYKCVRSPILIVNSSPVFSRLKRFFYSSAILSM